MAIVLIEVMMLASICIADDISPSINVYAPNPKKIVDTPTTITFLIQISNLRDNETIVYIEVIDYPEGWISNLSQSQIIIDPVNYDSEVVEEVSFSITPPQSTGHILETITLEFTPQYYPLEEDDPQGTPISLNLQVEIKGSSTPGFELLTLLIAFGLAFIFLRHKQ